MRTKKINFNGNAEVLINFLTEQFPKTYLSAFKVLLDLKYPISDKQVFSDQLEKVKEVKEDEVVKELLLNNFTPGDFGLESAINALDKFKLNLGKFEYAKPVNGFFEYPFTFGYNRVPEQEYFMHKPYMEYRTPYSYPREKIYPVGPTSGFYDKWNLMNETRPAYMYGEWEFGKDVCGEVAASLFIDLVDKGVREVLAYNMSREKEIACRKFMPVFETELNAKAQFIFANHFILLGKDVKQSFWASKFYLNKRLPGLVNQEPIGKTFEAVTPTMKKVMFEPVM